MADPVLFNAIYHPATEGAESTRELRVKTATPARVPRVDIAARAVVIELDETHRPASADCPLERAQNERDIGGIEVAVRGSSAMDDEAERRALAASPQCDAATAEAGEATNRDGAGRNHGTTSKSDIGTECDQVLIDGQRGLSKVLKDVMPTIQDAIEEGMLIERETQFAKLLMALMAVERDLTWTVERSSILLGEAVAEEGDQWGSVT